MQRIRKVYVEAIYSFTTEDVIILLTLFIYIFYCLGLIGIEFIIISLFLCLKLERIRRVITLIAGRTLEANLFISILAIVYFLVIVGVFEMKDIFNWLFFN